MLKPMVKLQSRKDHIIFGQMQPTVWRMIFRTCCHKQAQLENRLKDVAVLEEQMHLMLWGWKAELQAVPASSLPAETSSLESIDTWSGVAVKMMRMMML
ncbi:hypothetical protein BDL97_01G076000 [Sphagnum fallax]|nr:hypothetical protein BDL97_01G076000 [Sphagnum fallax]